MRTFKTSLLLGWLFHVQFSFAYRWPSPQYDALETFLYEGQRGDESNLASLVHPCRKRTGTGAAVAAEWLRFVSLARIAFWYTLICVCVLQAFHDMATHNVDDGSGGLDGSIVYELGRSEVRVLTSWYATEIVNSILELRPWFQSNPHRL